MDAFLRGRRSGVIGFGSSKPLRRCRRGGGISRRFQGGDFGQSRLERARSLFGAEVDTFCANERDVAHTKEAEEAGEIAFLMVGRRTVEAAAGRADDDSLGTAQTLAARCRVAECLSRRGKAVDPGLQLAWDAEVVHRGAEHNDIGRNELIERRVDGREVMLQLGIRSIVAWRVSYLHLYGPGVKCPALRKRLDFEVQQCLRVMG